MVKRILQGSLQPNNRRSAGSSGASVSVRTTAEVFPMGWKRFFAGYKTVCAMVDGRRKVECTVRPAFEVCHNAGSNCY